MFFHHQRAIVLLAALLVSFATTEACQCAAPLAEIPGSVSGRVCDADSGQPLAGASIELAGVVHRATLSNADGKYTFERVPHGHYGVTAKPPVGQERSFSVDVVSTGVNLVGVDEACRPPPAVDGNGGVTGQICNRHTGDFVADADVVLELPDGQQMAVRTDAQGRFAMPTVPAGTYVVDIRGEGYQRSVAVTVDDNGSATIDLAQDCHHASATEGGIVGAFCDPSVTMAPGQPAAELAGAIVTATPEGGDSSEGISDITDEHGAFEINGLTPGSYEVKVVSAHASFSFPGVAVAAGEQTPVADPSSCAPTDPVGSLDGQICDTLAGGFFVGD
ncbi:MAG TPA: carboxypeptidase regulatory-like domain-containing protein, partial [Myxococcota bacterium]